jgi:glucose 1-dehydrogenase
VSEHEFRLHPPDARLLQGRRALVTGATSGIGAGTAFELAAHGAAVAINHRGKVQEAHAMAHAIEAAGGRAVPVQMDISVEEDVRRGFAEAHAALGGLDLLVNNAGIEKPFDVVDMPLEEWERVIAVNLTGPFLCTREAARLMRADEARGVIVMISSVHEVIPWKQFSHYCASKGGLKLFAQSVANELAPHGIRVVSVAPGAIVTPINQTFLDDPEQRRKIEAEIAVGRFGEVSEVARTVAWVASEQAEYVVGATIFVDGGMTLHPNFV